ncbi:MAG: glycosyltransferase family 2 protein [Deltaproteobacteria bacterium]|nr:glycosyltransferase family 2 protein [Deltaproteobacteria bacterium]
MAEIIFWATVFVVFYTYIGYSLVIMLLSRFFNNPVNKRDYEPTVTFLITAYNEEKNIAQKLDNTLSLDYPKDRLEIIVASDGSTDRTDETVRGFSSRGVRLVRVEGRVGKTETQNRAVKSATGDIVIFSDATTRYENANIRKIVRNYADPSVGAVSGRYEYYNPTGATIGIGNVLFWKYENSIKSSQTRIKTITGCCGCIYSIRRKLYEPLPPDIISDLVEPLKILEKGYRIAFEPEAVAYEETTEKTSEEFNMRIRVISRGMRGLLYMKKLFNPLRFGFVSFQLFSHKLLRWLMPIFMIIILASNLFLTGAPIYNATLALQAAFYAMALVAWLGEKVNLKFKLLSVPLYFLTVNIASLISLYKTLKGYKAITWETVRK